MPSLSQNLERNMMFRENSNNDLAKCTSNSVSGLLAPLWTSHVGSNSDTKSTEAIGVGQ